MSSVYFGGSRSLGSLPVLASVVRAVQASGQVVQVGCCVGADAQVIAAASPSALVIFAQFAQGGAGACSFSAVQAVQQAAQVGASVRWLAGGPLSVPLKVRLIRRSVAAFAGCSSAVFFSPGAGSLAVAARAVQKMPVFAFGACPASLPGQAGQWHEFILFGASCWQWQAAQKSIL